MYYDDEISIRTMITSCCRGHKHARCELTRPMATGWFTTETTIVGINVQRDASHTAHTLTSILAINTLITPSAFHSVITVDSPQIP